MDMREIIARARRAQQQHPQRYAVQLGIEQEEILWASDEERMEHFYQQTFTREELEIHQRWELGIS